MTEINAIKSRLGSVSPTALATMPQSVQKLLKEDVPHLLNVVTEADIAMKALPQMDFTYLLRALRQLHEH